MSRGALVGSRASTPLTFLLSHTFRETRRTCRALFRRYQLFPEMEEMLIEKVRTRTILYDTKSPDYRDQHMRANAWEQIGKELKIKRKFYVSSRDVRIVSPRVNITLSLCISPFDLSFPVSCNLSDRCLSNFFDRGTFLALQNTHGSSHHFSRQCSVRIIRYSKLKILPK